MLGRSWPVNTAPEVPIEITTSPSAGPIASAAPALSPVPADTASPSGVCPTTSPGSATRGTSSARPNAISSRSGRYSPVTVDQ